ncbi:MAG: Gfo/Idh/MocA family oxidoreductase [Actinobacteria bacterium]|nr:Gfo/Idh/MocA family oxidoreductase [Actinomycetota bacterium]
MKRYRVAVVGLGRMGSTIDEEFADPSPSWVPYSIAATCRASDRLELAAGADIAPEKRAAFQAKWGVRALYEDYGRMLGEERPDLVAVCTRGPLHAEMGVRVAEAGVPMLYLEKAIACSMREADLLLTACRAHNTVFNSGVLNRFNSQIEEARRRIQAGEIGAPKVAVHFGARDLMHGHVHTIDTLSYLLGDPGILAVRGELHPRDLTITGNRLAQDPMATFQLRFAGGAEGWTLPAGTVELEVVGTEGTIRSLNNGSGLALRNGGAGAGRRSVWHAVDVPPVPPKSMVMTCLDDLVDAYESGRPTRGAIAIAHNNTEACLAVAESHREGGAWIDLPMANRDLYVFHR